SKRLADDERKRLRRILDDVRPKGHGLIVRTAAEGTTPDELRRDVQRLLAQREEIDTAARRSKAPAVLYRGPPLADRLIRDEANTGKTVGTSSLEETVYRNNLEAAEEVARQLRLRDIGGIIVIDFIDMEIRKNRDEVIRAFKEALARDKTRTQVFDISELGLVEMTRKRISEGLVESLSETCPTCNGRGIILD